MIPEQQIAAWINDVERRVADLERLAQRAGRGGAWTNLTLLNGWSPYGAPWTDPQYRIVGDVVELRGLLRGTSATAVTITTLPPGFRPTGSEIFILWGSGATSAACRVDINSAGVVSFNTAFGPSTPAMTIPFDHITLSGARFSIL